MAVYKVPQDVEADDKLIGPFSFKQFVFILMMVGFFYMTFLAWRVNPVFSVIPLPPALFFAVLGLWPRKDQPVEVYLLALIRFWFKPHKRLWSQEGHVEHVRINVPPNIDHQYSDGMTRGEVQSRLKMLAESLDSRGWTSKNVEVQDVAGSYQVAQQYSDRLVVPQALVPATPDPIDVHSSDDILDVDNNPLAQKFDDLSRVSAQKTREQAISQMSAPSSEATDNKVNFNPYPDIHQSVVNPIGSNAPVDEDDHSGMATEPKDDRKQEIGNRKQEGEEQNQQNTSVMTPGPTPAILNLSRNDDLNISTLARQAEQSLHDDVTIELH